MMTIKKNNQTLSKDGGAGLTYEFFLKRNSVIDASNVIEILDNITSLGLKQLFTIFTYLLRSLEGRSHIVTS